MAKQCKRVRLVKPEIADDHLPIGSMGTIVKGSMDKPGMLLIAWDFYYEIPMYCGELEEIKEADHG